MEVKQNSLSTLRLFAFILLYYVCVCNVCGCSPSKIFFSPYVATGGVLDCSKLDFTKENPVELKGEWKFKMYEDNPEYALADVDDSQWDMIKIPNYWNVKKYKGEGFGWFRLKVKVNNSFWESNPAIYLQGANTAYELYCNGKKVLYAGVAGVNRETSVPSLKPQFQPLHIHNNPKEIVIAVKVTNFYHRGGGLNKSIVIGSFDSISKLLWQRDFSATLILGILIITTIYHIILFFGRMKDKSSLWFSIFCFAVFSHSFVVGNYLEQIFSNQKIYFIRFAIEYASLGLGWSSLALYIYSLFPRETGRIFIFFLVIAGLIFICVPILFPPQIFTKLIDVFNLFLLISLIGSFYILIIASFRKREDALLILCGFIILMLSFLNDMLHNLFIIRTAFISEYGLAFFILFQSSVLSLRFSRAFKLSEYLSNNLNEEVNKKTSELLQKTEEALTARQEAEETYKKLSALYQQMSHEIHLAKIVHDRIIPKECSTFPEIKVTMYTKPFMEIGGDFYDIVMLPAGQTRIFVADATGHGISASLATILIKVEYDKIKEVCAKPSEVLGRLNDIFSEYYRSLKMYITGVVVDINTKNNYIIYASAGHPDQIMVKNGNIHDLSRTGPAIGISRTSVYKDQNIEFNQKDTLFLFTDGILEELNPVQFENGYDELKTFIKKFSYTNAEETINAIKKHLEHKSISIPQKDDEIIIGIDFV
ncbi:MAG: SpoIIE family protein phosphatase [Spirochaetota bacterium]